MNDRILDDSQKIDVDVSLGVDQDLALESEPTADFSEDVELHDPRLALDLNAEDALANILVEALLHDQPD